jgi:hypothetical protein
MKRCLFGLLFFAFCAGFGLVACSKSPTQPPQVIPRTADGVYRGHSTLDGSDSQNIVLRVQAPDSNGHYSGTIRFGGVASLLSSVTTDSLVDSIFISYVRSGTAYAAKSRITEAGLALRYTSHTAIPTVLLNREIDGYNLTGEWQGEMLSELFDVIRSAELDAVQVDVLLDGEVRVNFFGMITGDIQSGAVNNEFFQLSGTASYSGNSSEFLMVGTYSSSDSIAGNWYLGPNGSQDSGIFLFFRSY